MQKTQLTQETTDFALFIQTSNEEIKNWDRSRITKALLRETSLDYNTSDQIAKEVEETIKNGNIKRITTPLVRELVDAKLIEHGFEEARMQHTRLGVPVYDAEQIISFPNKENANVPHNPEATNLMLAGKIKKEFALCKVFSHDVAEAHISGDIHIHNLDFPDRPHCSGQSLEYIKKFGLHLPNSLSNAKPAKYAETLLAHLMKFSAALQGHFSGAIGWDAINIFFAPYLEGLSKKEIKQIAQMLIYEYSQQAVARGGQAIFSDINLYWEIPDHFADVPAIGPGGKFTGKTYKEYIKISQQFLLAILEVYKEGDASGRPFMWPKGLFHLTEKTFQVDGWEFFLEATCEVASLMGNPYFVFDRGGTAKISQCCRLAFRLNNQDLQDAKEPWRMRYSALEVVTINLPRIAYKAEHNIQSLFAKLGEVLQLVVKAHQQKRDYIQKLLDAKDQGPLVLLTMNHDGDPYLKLNKASYLVGILGLNEMVQYHTGQQLHESPEALSLGLRIIAYMNRTCKELAKQHNTKLVLEQTPAESTTYRLAKIDMEAYPTKAVKVVKGCGGTGLYYTNSTQLNTSLPINPIDRIKVEGLFHDMIEAGALTHIWIGDANPSPTTLAQLIKKIFYNTRNAQVAISPEFTTCNDCGKIERGLHDKCSYCESLNVDGITRVTGYFSKISGWNPGKRKELQDRHRNSFNGETSLNLYERLTAQPSSDKIEIFGVDMCSACQETEKALDKRNISYVFYDAHTIDGMVRLAKYELLEEAGKQLPIIKMNGQVFLDYQEFLQML